MIELIFFCCLFLIFYVYVGYIISLIIIQLFAGRDIEKSQIFPTVSIIIVGHNEEKNIQQKMENTLLLDYPKNKLQIIFVSDGSTDNTNKLLNGFQNEIIDILLLDDRKGKESGQSEALKIASGEIIVFTDVSTNIEKNGLAQIISNFADETIGCVTSEDRVTGQDSNASREKLYIRYDTFIRRLESKVSSVIGMSGSFFAARRELCSDFADTKNIDSDFLIVLNSKIKGLRGVNDPESVGIYSDVSSRQHEFNRKTRTVLRGLSGLFSHFSILNIFKFGLFSYQIFCHKLLRWLTPLFFLSLFLSNIYLYDAGYIFSTLLICQSVIYILGLIGLFAGDFYKLNIFLRLPAFFLFSNFAVIVGWIKFFRGEKMVVWSPSVR